MKVGFHTGPSLYTFVRSKGLTVGQACPQDMKNSVITLVIVISRDHPLEKEVVANWALGFLTANNIHINKSI